MWGPRPLNQEILKLQMRVARPQPNHCTAHGGALCVSLPLLPPGGIRLYKCRLILLSCLLAIVNILEKWLLYLWGLPNGRLRNVRRAWVNLSEPSDGISCPFGMAYRNAELCFKDAGQRCPTAGCGNTEGRSWDKKPQRVALTCS